MTAKDSYTEMEQVRQRLIELLHYHKHRLSIWAFTTRRAPEKVWTRSPRLLTESG